MPSEKTINKFMMKAREASFQSDFPRQRIGAVLVYGNKVLAVGCNTLKTAPLQYFANKARNFDRYDVKNQGALHSECVCLLKTRYLDLDWHRTTLYVYRETKKGQRANSRPCLACQVALQERGITNVFYSTESGWQKL